MNTHLSKHDLTSHTSERLLNTAERLFGKYGYDGVGMRTLADEAGVNLGAMTYHFGSKEKLYIETFMRRFTPVNVAQMDLLVKAQEECKGKPLLVETIVECLVRPPCLSALKYPHFPRMLVRNLFMPPPFMRRVLAKESKNKKVFVDALAKALPNLSVDYLMVRLTFLRGVLVMFPELMSHIPTGTTRKQASIESIVKEMVGFISSGFQTAPVAPNNQ